MVQTFFNYVQIYAEPTANVTYQGRNGHVSNCHISNVQNKSTNIFKYFFNNGVVHQVAY